MENMLRTVDEELFITKTEGFNFTLPDKGLTQKLAMSVEYLRNRNNPNLLFVTAWVELVSKPVLRGQARVFEMSLDSNNSETELEQLS